MNPMQLGGLKGPNEGRSAALTLYCRSRDGGNPVEVFPEGYRLGSEIYTSKRQLLIAATGHPTGRNWTWNRYFRLGKWAPEPLTVPTLDLVEFFTTTGTGPKGGLVVQVKPKLGIDLTARGGEVAKILFAGFGSWIYSGGYDPEDVLQEVYRGILTRNAGKCPWDARKSSFGHYVHMVCQGVLSNWHRKIKRKRENEVVGVLTCNDHGDLVIGDVGSSNLPASQTSQPTEILQATADLLSHIPSDPATYLARRIVPLIRDGYTLVEMARLLGVKKSAVSEALAVLRHYAGTWGTR